MISGPGAKATQTAEAPGANDCSVTRHVPSGDHAEFTDAVAVPRRSTAGWERAVAAQHRLADHRADLLVDRPDDVAVIGHGGVGMVLSAGSPVRRSTRGTIEPAAAITGASTAAAATWPTGRLRSTGPASPTVG